MGRYKRHLESLEYEGFVKSTFESLVETYGGRVYHNRLMTGLRSGHAHQVDIVIEAEVAQLQILILIECKYYSKTVEIGDILEFAQRIDDIGAHKGVVVSTVGFQDGAVKIARAHRIALITTLPVWQHILYSRNGDEILGFTPREIYLGGDSDDDFLIGVTVESVSHSINIHSKLTDAWREIVGYLVADSDTSTQAQYLRESLQRQYSCVCPFCGERLRGPLARQCESCYMDWHNLANPIRRNLETTREPDELNQFFAKLAEVIANKFSTDQRWIHLSTDIAADLGADHIDFVELLLEIEERFDLTFGDDFDENASYEVRNIFGYIVGKTEPHRGKGNRG